MARKEIADSSELSAANEDCLKERSTPTISQSNRPPKSKGVPICSEIGKVIGQVVEDEFVKRVIGSKHMLRQPPAWAFDVVSLEQAERAGATLVKVIDTESVVKYSAPLSRIWDRGREFNRGFGDQIFMVLGDWDTEGGGSAPRQRGLPRKSKAITEPSHVQMSMFGSAS